MHVHTQIKGFLDMKCECEWRSKWWSKLVDGARVAQGTPRGMQMRAFRLGNNDHGGGCCNNNRNNSQHKSAQRQASAAFGDQRNACDDDDHKENGMGKG